VKSIAFTIVAVTGITAVVGVVLIKTVFKRTTAAAPGIPQASGGLGNVLNNVQAIVGTAQGAANLVGSIQSIAGSFGSSD
jgi:hypothetical protein